MACSNCNTSNCGCSGTYKVSQTCPPACSEVFNTACIVYTGVDITCTNSQTGLSSTVVSRNDYLDTALTSIVNFFCARVNESLTSTIVTTASAPYLAVTSSLVGSVTTFSVDLDIDAVAAAVDGNTTVVEAGGTNVTVDETVVGSVTTYTVTAQGTDVVSGDDFIDVSVTQVGDDDVVTLTLDINEVEDALGEVSVAQGTSDHVVVTTVNNFPTTGDTQYRLDTISTDVVSTDPILTVVTTPGVAPDYDQVFTLDLDDALLGDFIMDTAGANIVGTGGITVAYDAIAHQITIGETIGIPDQWKIISDSVLDITAGSPTDKLSIVSGVGTAVALVAGVNEGTFTVTNTDLGSSQLIFGSVDCNNGGPSVGTCSASTNTDALTLVGGAEIDLSVVGNTITIDNLITKVYSNVVGDDAVSLQANSTTDTLDILGGDRISTSGTAAPGGNELTVTFDGVAIGAGLTGSGTTADPLVADGVTLASAGGTTLVNDGVGPALQTKGLTAGDGIGLSSTATEVTIIAEVRKKSTTTPSGVPGWSITYNHALATESVSVVVSSADTPYPQTVYVHGTDYNLEFVDQNQVKVTDIGGALSATTVRLLVIG